MCVFSDVCFTFICVYTKATTKDNQARRYCLVLWMVVGYNNNNDPNVCGINNKGALKGIDAGLQFDFLTNHTEVLTDNVQWSRKMYFYLKIIWFYISYSFTHTFSRTKKCKFNLSTSMFFSLCMCYYLICRHTHTHNTYVLLDSSLDSIIMSISVFATGIENLFSVRPKQTTNNYYL